MATKTPKKKESRERVSSSTAPKTAPEPSVSQGANDKDKGQKAIKHPISIWPEWSDQDIASEKWDTSHKGKDKEKGKSPNLHAFEDPEGRVDLPRVFQTSVECWKRPVDFIEDKTPVIVDLDSVKEKEIDLTSSSSFDVISLSEIMRCIIADITNLFKLKPHMDTIEVRYGKDTKDVVQNEDCIWKPWQHIWPKEKSKNGVYPVYNTGGKYVVKVYWMGCWRKVTIDDWMPFNSEGQLLLPSCKKSHELWPMLLTKALLKVASLDYNGGELSCEFGDFSVIQCLTGWIPEVIPLRHEYSNELWETLGKILPHWKLENSITVEEAKEVNIQPVKKKDEKEKKSREKLERGAVASQNASDRSLERESRLRDKDSKERFLSNAGSSMMMKDVIKEPEFAVFASYCNPPKTPLRVCVLREMADSSEKLRQSGLSHNHPHSVMVTIRRDCPLVAPPPPVEIPRWRLIRQKKNKQPRDLRLTPIELPKEPQFLEITSPFVGYCVSSIPVPRVKTPKFAKYRPDKDKMAEISEEGDKPDDGIKKEGEGEMEQVVVEEKTNEVVAVETPSSGKDEVTNNLDKRGSITARSDKSDEKKDTTTKMAKDATKTMKSEKTVNQDKDTKQSKSKKMSRDQSNEKKNDPTTPSKTAGRRMSKADVRGVSEKELKKLAKAVEAKNEIKIEMTDTTEETLDNVGEDGGQTLEENQENQDGAPKTNKDKTFWIEYDDFWKCFGFLHIYHKPVTYMYTKSHLELKNVASTTHNKKSGIGLHTSSMATQNSGKGQTAAPIPVGHHGLGGIPIDPPPPFLFVDSVDVIEIVVCLTSFSKWLDPPQPIFREKGRESGSNSELKVESATELNPVSPTPGLLVAEPYTWKSLVTGQHCLKIKSTGSKAAVLVLPPGRHLLRFLLQSPNGYHVGLCSQTPFTFGDEDQVMICLQKESCRFIEYTTSIVQNIGNIVSSFSELRTNNKHTILDLGVKEQPQHMQEKHYQVFMICLLETLSAQLGEEYTRDMHFAWKAFDFIAQVYLKERFTFRPRSSADVARIGSVHKKRSDLSRCLSSSSHRMATIDDNSAAIRIQAAFRGYYIRKLNRAYKPESSIHQQVQENLAKAWGIIENNMETFSIQLYRRMYKLDSNLFQMFPFYNDEWTRVTHNDYNGSFMEQPANTWFLLFREVFFVDEEILSLPKMYSNIPTCFLRVINNDTFEEIPKVFQRVAPYNFTKNKHGYTFLAEARTTLSSLASGKFRFRLIGSTEPLPAPEGDSVNAQFVTKEIKDYYMPNKDRILLRYSVQVTEDQLITVQLGTSKTDVLIKLQILDHEGEVISSCGRGHAVLPVYIVRRDRHAGEEENRQRKRGSRPQSKDSKDGETARAGTAGGKNPKSKSKKGKDNSPAHSRPGSLLDKRNEGRGMNRSITQEEDMKPQVHKYIIQALVLRDSWPLSRESWDFVLTQRNAEKPDPPDLSESANRGEKSTGQGKSKKSKDGKESRSSKNQSGSRPASQQLNFDTTKPHWTLRIVTDAGFADDIDVKKDTERQDEIRAMKVAWETAQPGRAAKAYQSRQKFLNEHLIQVKDPETEEGDQGQGEEQGEVADISSSSASVVPTEQEEYFTEPPPRQPSRVLKPFDITPFVRCGGTRIVLDATEENKRRQQKQEIFRQHKQWRDEVEKRRDMDRQQRNIAKERQIQMAEEWQAALDKVREDINTAREAYRQTFIVQEPPEEEVIEPVKERTPSPAKGRKGSKSPKGARKSPKAKKK